MKIALALLPLLLIGAADTDEAERAETDAPSTFELSGSTAPEPRIDMPDTGALDDDRCAKRIREVRRDRGLPELRREPAEPGDASLWYAVDRRIEGCTVLVRHGDAEDVRPFPETRDGPLFRRVPAGED